VRVVYTDHLKLRLRARRIPEGMPERIYREATERYYNHATFRPLVRSNLDKFRELW